MVVVQMVVTIGEEEFVSLLVALCTDRFNGSCDECKHRQSFSLSKAGKVVYALLLWLFVIRPT